MLCDPLRVSAYNAQPRHAENSARSLNSRVRRNQPSQDQSFWTVCLFVVLERIQPHGRGTRGAAAHRSDGERLGYRSRSFHLGTKVSWSMRGIARIIRRQAADRGRRYFEVPIPLVRILLLCFSSFLFWVDCTIWWYGKQPFSGTQVAQQLSFAQVAQWRPGRPVTRCTECAKRQGTSSAMHLIFNCVTVRL